MKEAARDCGGAIHAYVLMTNHFHLLLTPTENGAPPRLMQSLGHRYVQYANRFHADEDGVVVSSKPLC